jgi:hypothetical protein
MPSHGEPSPTTDIAPRYTFCAEPKYEPEPFIVEIRARQAASQSDIARQHFERAVELALEELDYDDPITQWHARQPNGLRELAEWVVAHEA